MTPTQFKNHRQMLGITQTQMGELLALSKRQVQNYEDGTHPVPALVVHRLKTLTKKELRLLLTKAK